MPTISCTLNLSGYVTDIYCHVKASVDYFVKLLTVESILYSLLLCKLDHICKIVHTYKYIHSLFHLRQSLFPVSYISTCPKQNCSNKISLSLSSLPPQWTGFQEFIPELVNLSSSEKFQCSPLSISQVVFRTLGINWPYSTRGQNRNQFHKKRFSFFPLLFMHKMGG